MTQPLTVLIPCKNEREQLAACIGSVKDLASEVLVADSGSTDGSLEIARAMGARVIEREFHTYGDFLNWAIPQASHPWVFVLDGDERVTPTLAAEIRAVVARPEHDGYRIPRLNYFLGHAIRFGPWKNDQFMRLFRRDLGYYEGPTDHAMSKLRSGTVGQIRARLIHYTCTSYDRYLPKLQRYAAVQAAVWHEQGRRTSIAQHVVAGPTAIPPGLLPTVGIP